MKLTLLKKDGRKEVINRVELADLAAAIKDGRMMQAVRKMREVYHLMNPHRLADGQVSTQWEGGVRLPRICFAADYQNRKGEWRMIGYNGLVVLEVNDLQTYEKAVEIRELAKKLPETMLCFLGGSGRSVKIVCRGELYQKEDVRGKKEDVRSGGLTDICRPPLVHSQTTILISMSSFAKVQKIRLKPIDGCIFFTTFAGK